MVAGPVAEHETSQLKKNVVAGDIVIENPRPGAFVIEQVGGKEIGTVEDRLDAMRCACAVARMTDANVWIYHAENSKYQEILCP